MLLQQRFTVSFSQHVEKFTSEDSHGFSEFAKLFAGMRIADGKFFCALEPLPEANHFHDAYGVATYLKKRTDLRDLIKGFNILH